MMCLYYLDYVVERFLPPVLSLLGLNLRSQALELLTLIVFSHDG